MNDVEVGGASVDDGRMGMQQLGWMLATLGACGGGGDAQIDASAADAPLPAPLFGEPTVYETPDTLYPSLALADFNGDGKLDVAAGAGSVMFGMAHVDIYLNLGGGALGPVAAFQAGFDAHALAAGDLNGDGKADLVVANFDAHAVSVLIGNGDGTFTAAVQYTTQVADSVVITDVNGDGKRDIIAANIAGVNVLSVLINNGDGTFAPAVEYPTPVQPRSLIAEDFDSDGKPDLVVTNESEATISLHRNSGNGTFAAPVKSSTGIIARPIDLASGDLDGDGKPDLVVSGLSQPNSLVVIVLHNNGDGTFTAQLPTPGGGGVGKIAVAELDGRGQLDLLVAHSMQPGVTAVLDDGTGVLRQQLTYAPGQRAIQALAVGDLNGDGKPDMVVSAVGPNMDLAVVLHVP